MYAAGNTLKPSYTSTWATCAIVQAPVLVIILQLPCTSPPASVEFLMATQCNSPPAFVGFLMATQNTRSAGRVGSSYPLSPVAGITPHTSFGLAFSLNPIKHVPALPEPCGHEGWALCSPPPNNKELKLGGGPFPCSGRLVLMDFSVSNSPITPMYPDSAWMMKDKLMRPLPQLKPASLPSCSTPTFAIGLATFNLVHVFVIDIGIGILVSRIFSQFLLHFLLQRVHWGGLWASHRGSTGGQTDQDAVSLGRHRGTGPGHGHAWRHEPLL